MTTDSGSVSGEPSYWEKRYKTLRAVHMERMRKFRQLEKEAGKNVQRLSSLRSELEEERNKRAGAELTAASWHSISEELADKYAAARAVALRFFKSYDRLLRGNTEEKILQEVVDKEILYYRPE